MLASEIWGNEGGIFFNFLAIKNFIVSRFVSRHIRHEERVYFSREIAEKKKSFRCVSQETLLRWNVIEKGSRETPTLRVWEAKFIVACVFISNFQNSSKAVMRRRVNICDSFTTSSLNFFLFSSTDWRARTCQVNTFRDADLISF